MDAILEKIKADIISRPLISTLILATISVTATLLTLALATLMNLSGPYDQSFQALNGAHLWLHFNRDRIRARDIEWIEALPQVTESTGLQYSVETQVRIGETRVETSLRAMPTDIPAVNRLLLHEGRYLTDHQPELIANEEFNYYYQLEVGDTISLEDADGKDTSLPVVGSAYNPVWDIYRNSQPSYLYLTEETLHLLFPDRSSWDWSIGVRLADPEAVDEVVELIKGQLRSNAVESQTDWRDVRTSAAFEAQLNFVFLSAFSFFAILATVLVVANSISSVMLSQFKQIGMLKAIGFTQMQILWLYLGQYFILGLAGSFIGLLLGIALSPLPLQSVAVSLDTTFQPPLNPFIVAAVMSINPGVVILATLGTAYRGARTNIIKAIATGAEAPKKRVFWGVRLASRLSLPVVFVLGLEEVFARPFRSFLTGLNLTLGVVGIVFGLTLNATLETYENDPALLGVIYDAVVTREETSDGRTRHLLQRAPGVEAFYGQSLVEVKTAAEQKFQLRAMEGDLTPFPIQIVRGRLFRPDSFEAIAGRGLLDWLGLEIGDEITLIVADKESRPVTWTIVGQYVEGDNAGQMMMVSLPSVARAARQLRPSSYYLKLSADAEPEALKQYLAPKPDSDLNLTVVNQVIPDSFIYLQLSIFVLAIILIGVALINVFNTSLLAMQERLKMIGILKTLGVTPSQVSAMVNTTAGFLGMMAVVVGIPLGLVFTKGMLTLLSSLNGVGSVAISINLFHILLLIPLMVGTSMIGSFIPGRQAARAPIVRVLRHQ